MRFCTLLWDMDGTLFDTYPPIRRAVIAAFAANGVRVDPARVADLLAVTFEDCVTTLAAEHNADLAAVKAHYFAHQPNISLTEQPPFPGVIDVCRHVVAAGGRNLIYTHRERESLDHFLAHYGMADLFADTLTQDEGMPRKPDPTGFNTILDRSAIPRSEVLAVGDRDLDILAGIRAGIATCLYDAAPSPDAPPDYVVNTYAELDALLFGDEA
jgi:phosphoglycolate phosphatase-like HAD superfamily hydrolase